jgi:hypothetical protein
VFPLSAPVICAPVRSPSLCFLGVLFQLLLTVFLPLDKFLAEFKAMLKNRQFLILQGSFGIGYGIFVALLSDLDQILATYQYTELQAGNLGIILICSGIAGAFTMGVVIG